MPSINTSKRNIEKKSTNNGYPDLSSHTERVLVIVKASPNPSDKYRETVCTVCVTEKNRLIRLYPIPFRYINFGKRFGKYQWIKVEIKKRPFEKDLRLDSYEPIIESIKPVGEPLPAGKWIERKKVILPLVSRSMEEIREKYDKEKVSLGIFKPKTVQFKIEEGEKDWSPNHRKVLAQGRLFEEQPKELEKMPYKFSYEITCNESKCTGHTMQIIDWELTELYRKMKDKFGFSMDLVLEKVKETWYSRMWDENRDSYLIVGSIYPYASFNVLGVFWPPK